MFSFFALLKNSAVFYPEYFEDSYKNYSSNAKINHLPKYVIVTTLIFRVEH